jgi:hypothetical protein
MKNSQIVKNGNLELEIGLDEDEDEERGKLRLGVSGQGGKGAMEQWSKGQGSRQVPAASRAGNTAQYREERKQRQILPIC